MWVSKVDSLSWSRFDESGFWGGETNSVSICRVRRLYKSQNASGGKGAKAMNLLTCIMRANKSNGRIPRTRGTEGVGTHQESICPKLFRISENSPCLNLPCLGIGTTRAARA
jgi:hypothetical protein